MHDSTQQVSARLGELATLFEPGPAALLTGAGISTDSGIPDYRGAGTPPRTPMRIEQFLTDHRYRQRFWAGSRIGAIHLSKLTPNAGHRAAAALEHAGQLSGVITQNVDGLHRQAGTVNLAELHGTGETIRCVPEAHRFTRVAALAWFDQANPGFAAQHAEAPMLPDLDADLTGTHEVRIPTCPACGGMLRPDVVYFGEHVASEVFAHAEQIVASAHALIVAGSSLTVNTGVRLVHRARSRQLPVAVINRGPTQIDHREFVRVRIEGGTTETLVALAARLAGAEWKHEQA